MSAPITWDAERVRVLEECVAQKLSARKIAAKLGISRNAVLGRIHRSRKVGPGLSRSERARLSHRKSEREAVLTLVNVPPRVFRDPCFLCGVRGDIGCQHNRWAA